MSTQANDLTPMFETTNGKTIYTRPMFDHTDHDGGRGWEVLVGVTEGRAPERVCTVAVDRPFLSASREFQPKVNWSAWGAQAPETAAAFAEALQFAAQFAHDETVNLTAEEGASA